jgi:hypothetical protein
MPEYTGLVQVLLVPLQFHGTIALIFLTALQA